jgi:5-dehydro-2-deoxygluconokinase
VTPGTTGSPLDVLAIGRSLVDLYPAQDGPLEAARSFEKSVGGSPTNVAIAATRLGRRSGVISRVGDDAFGRFVRAELEALGVDVSQVREVSGGVTPIAIPEISPPEHFPLTIYRPDPAVDVAIRTEELHEEVIASAAILWTSLSGLAAEPARSAHQRVAELRGPGADLVIDLDYRRTFWASDREAGDAARAAASSATVLIGNLEECRIVTGATDADSAADRLLALGARLVVVKLGGDGVLAATSEDRVRVLPLRISVANGLGSGDAFGGALCHGLLSGWDLARLIEFANASGALVASRRGCSTAMPTQHEIDALLVTSRRA